MKMTWHKRYSDGKAHKTENNRLQYYYNEYGDYIRVIYKDNSDKPSEYKLVYAGFNHNGCYKDTKLKNLMQKCDEYRKKFK